MNASNLWIQDIEELRSLGTKNIRFVGEDLADAAEKAKNLRISHAAFGDEEVSQLVSRTYDHVRSSLQAAVSKTSDQVRKVADAVVDIADHQVKLQEKIIN